MSGETIQSHDILSLVHLRAPLNPEGVRRLARHGCLDIHRVQWLRAYLAIDGTRMLGWYRAADAESVRLVLRQQGFADAVVLLATVSGNTRNATDEGFIVELPTRPSHEGAASLMRRRAAAALTTGGQHPGHIFTSRRGDQLMCFVAGHDEKALDACLRAAEMVPVSVWRSVAFDPQPRKLFEISPGGNAVPLSTEDKGHGTHGRDDLGRQLGRRERHL